jgi:hypothetical protein
MTQFLTALSSTVLVYATVTRGALGVARVLELLTGKSKSSKRPPSGGHPARS